MQEDELAAAAGGITVDQFIAAAATEKLSAFLRVFAPSREPDRNHLNAGKEGLGKSGKEPKDQSQRINREAG